MQSYLILNTQMLRRHSQIKIKQRFTFIRGVSKKNISVRSRGKGGLMDSIYIYSHLLKKLEILGYVEKKL